MKCPVCEDVDLKISERQGIEIDYCPKCRGVWLDRGELDKIIDRSAAWRPQSQQQLTEVMQPKTSDEYYYDESAPKKMKRKKKQRYDDDYRDDYDDDDRRYKGRDDKRRKKRKSFLSEIFDEIFD